MNICEAHTHTVVVHNDLKCPLCELEDVHKADTDYYEAQIKAAEDKLDAYKTDLRSYAELVQDVSSKEGVVE